MVRNRKRKTDIGLTDENVMKYNGVLKVINENVSARQVARDLNINRTTLQRYINKFKASSAEDKSLFMFKPNYSVNKILPSNLEDSLKNYLIEISRRHHGLTRTQVMRFAYQLAEANNLKVPETWQRNKSAGYDWFYEFKKRFPELSVRKPESTSLARATAFNKENVHIFYSNLEEVYGSYENGIDPGAIYNLDETALTTVHNPPKIVAKKGEKQVGQVTSGERGVLVTACCIISASGCAIPPCLIFPRVNFKDYMLAGAPPGTSGFATKTGWMNGDIFLDVLKHFQNNVRCNKQNKVVLILDNHESHITIASLNFCKDNGIIMLTLPPHTSNRLQPLDKTVYKSLKTFFNAACNDWMVSHPAKAITIYDIASLFGKAYGSAFTVKNIVSGFQTCGIWPYNRNIFTEEDFLGSAVTDRPYQEPTTSHHIQSTNGKVNEVVILERPVVLEKPKINIISEHALREKNEAKELVLPEELKPFPTAELRKETKCRRKRKKSVILTKTPVKDEICEELEKKMRKKNSR